jgi:hypothetical protein
MRLEDFFSSSPKNPLSRAATWAESCTASTPILDLISHSRPHIPMALSRAALDAKGVTPEEMRSQEELLDRERKKALRAADMPDSNPLQREIARKRRRKYPHVINKYDAKATPSAASAKPKSPETALRAPP